MKQPPPLPSDDVEVIPVDEEEDIDRTIEVMRTLLSEDVISSGKRRRDVHVKSHGAPTAQFQVLSALNPELKQGLFAQPATYPARVRFSSSSPWSKPDIVPDARGLAIQLRDEITPGEENSSPGVRQDFIMINQSAFIARDVKAYLRIQQARLKLTRPRSLLSSITNLPWNPQNWHWNELLTSAKILAQPPLHPACHTYYSMVPIRYGDYVAKYRVRLLSSLNACSVAMMRSLFTQPDAFRLALTETLRSTALTFEFQVQLRTDAESMPVEDASITWPERLSPFRTVAHLLIPRQELGLPPECLGNDLAFNVWNCSQDHRPLGGINRVRKAAYEASRKWRQS